MSAITRRDDWLLIVAGLLLCVELFVLLSQLKVLNFELPWGGQTETRQTIGRVLEKHKTLKDRSARSLTWYPLAKGEAIRADDIVMTGNGSSARIQIEGEGELVLGPDTFVSFAVDRSNPKKEVLKLDVNQGVVTVKSEKLPVAVKVKNQEMVLESGSVVQLSKKLAAKESRIAVTKGKVALNSELTSDAVGELVAGEVVKIPESAPVAKVPTKLEVEYLYPAQGQRLIAKTEESKIPFKWKSEQGETVQVADNPDFKEALNFTADREEASGMLRAGKYYWRVISGDSKGDTSEFILLPPVQYVSMMAPGSLREGNDIFLQWKEVPQASVYRFQLSRTEDFSEIVREESVNRNTIGVGHLEGGVYYWRIQAEHPTLGSWPFSAAFPLTVKKPLSAPKPKGIKRFKKEGRLQFDRLYDWLIPTAHAETLEAEPIEVVIEWEKTQGAVGYHLQIAEDPRFKTMLVQKNSTEPTTNATLPKRERYYWRVAGRDKDGELGAFSQTQMILYADLMPPEPPIPPPGFSAVEKKEEPPKPKPAVVLKRREIPKKLVKRPPPRKDSILSLGLSGKQINQTARATNLQVEQSGLAMGRLDADYLTYFGESSLVISFWLEPRAYQSLDNLPTTVQSERLHLTEMGLRSLWTFDRSSGIPWTVGLKYSRTVEFSRTGDESADAHPLDIISVVGGALFEVGDKPHYKFDLLFDLSPIGYAKGYGAEIGIRTGYRRLWFDRLTPEFHLALHKTYYSLNSKFYDVSTVNLLFGISLGWEFEG